MRLRSAAKFRPSTPKATIFPTVTTKRHMRRFSGLRRTCPTRSLPSVLNLPSGVICIPTYAGASIPRMSAGAKSVGNGWRRIQSNSAPRRHLPSHRSGVFATPGRMGRARVSIPSFSKPASIPGPFRRWCAPDPTPRSKSCSRSASRSRSTRTIPIGRCANAALITGGPAILPYFAAGHSSSSCVKPRNKGSHSFSGWSISPPGVCWRRVADHRRRQRVARVARRLARLPLAPRLAALQRRRDPMLAHGARTMAI